MSLDDLESDVTRNASDLDQLQFAGFGDIKDYLKQTLFPLLENIVTEIKEIDEDVSDMVEKSEDILQPETAGIFAAVITQCRALAGALLKRIPANDPEASKWKGRVKTVLDVCQQAQDTLLEITVTPDEEDDVVEEPDDNDETEDADGDEGADDVDGK